MTTEETPVVRTSATSINQHPLAVGMLQDLVADLQTGICKIKHTPNRAERRMLFGQYIDDPLLRARQWFRLLYAYSEEEERP